MKTRHLVAGLLKHTSLILAAGVFIGLLLPGTAAALHPLLAPSVWGLLVLAMLRIDWPQLTQCGQRGGGIALIVAWLLVISPLTVAALLQTAGAPAGLTAAIVLMAAAPPIMSAPAMALLIGLDAPLMLVVMVIATFAMPLVVPIVALELLALSLDVGVGALMVRLMGMIGTAALAASLIRRMVRGRNLAAPVLDLIALVLLLTFAIAIMAGVKDRLIDRPDHVLAILAAAFAANIGLQAVAAVVFAWLDRRTALTAAFASGNRNMGLLLAVMPADVDSDILLYFALGQIPIYVMPALLTPLYRRLLPQSSS